MSDTYSYEEECSSAENDMCEAEDLEVEGKWNEAIEIYKRISNTDDCRCAFEATRACLLLHLKYFAINNNIYIDLDTIYMYFQRLLQLFHTALPFRRKDVILEIIHRTTLQLQENTNAQSLIIAMYDEAILCVQVLHCNDIWFTLNERFILCYIRQNQLNDAALILERFRTTNPTTYSCEQRCKILELEVEIFGCIKDEALFEDLYREVKRTDSNMNPTSLVFIFEHHGRKQLQQSNLDGAFYDFCGELYDYILYMMYVQYVQYCCSSIV
jgi:hypothetical protein